MEIIVKYGLSFMKESRHAISNKRRLITESGEETGILMYKNYLNWDNLYLKLKG